MTAIFSVHNVSKAYGATRVLSRVSFEVRAGECAAIVGFSGAGKTTLISLLAGLTLPDSGEVLFGGEPVTGPGPERGVVFQNYSLLPWLTAFENVALAVGQVFSNWSRQKQHDHTERYLNLVGLGHAHSRRPCELSGGMRQRVALARALAADAQVLLLDEPLSALDALTRATLQDELDRIRRTTGKTIVLVTNDVDEAILLADRILPLSAGPAATLGPATPIPIPRPRERKALQHNPEFRRIRALVIDYLLESRRSRQGDFPRSSLAPLAATLEVPA